MSISFSGHIFSDPVPVATWMPPYQAGIYAILIPDSSAKPLPFRVIYFSESGNLSDRAFLRGHHRYLDWLQISGSEYNLYIAIHLMPDSTKEERSEVEAHLKADYGVI